MAAAGLMIIMLGATVFTLATADPALGLIPLVVGLLSAFVAYGRWRLSRLDLEPPVSRRAAMGWTKPTSRV